jgi:hypothetical protein
MSNQKVDRDQLNQYERNDRRVFRSFPFYQEEKKNYGFIKTQKVQEFYLRFTLQLVFNFSICMFSFALILIKSVWSSQRWKYKYTKNNHILFPL